MRNIATSDAGLQDFDDLSVMSDVLTGVTQSTDELSTADLSSASLTMDVLSSNLNQLAKNDKSFSLDSFTDSSNGKQRLLRRV